MRSTGQPSRPFASSVKEIRSCFSAPPLSLGPQHKSQHQQGCYGFYDYLKNLSRMRLQDQQGQVLGSLSTSRSPGIAGTVVCPAQLLSHKDLLPPALGPEASTASSQTEKNVCVFLITFAASPGPSLGPSTADWPLRGPGRLGQALPRGQLSLAAVPVDACFCLPARAVLCQCRCLWLGLILGRCLGGVRPLTCIKGNFAS